MTKGVQQRRGNTVQHSTFNGEPGEITVNTDRWTVVVQDGSTNGGYEHVNLNSTQRLSNKDIVATNLVVSGVSTFSNISATNISGFNVTSGIATFGANATVVIGTGTSTGTANQDLQVTGNVYFSGNTGIGTTNAASALHVNEGQLRVTRTSGDHCGLFSGSTSSDMVRITQTGSGNALFIEDSASPDSTPFVVHSAGPVGCGTDNPGAQLHVQVTTGGPAPTAGLFSGTSASLNEPIVRITQLSSSAPALTVSTGVGLTNPGMQVTGIGSVGVGVIGVGVTGKLTIGAGDVFPNTAPVKLISGSLLSVAEQGAIEYVRPTAHFTGLGTERGLILAPQYFVLNADRTGPTDTSSTSIFGVGFSLAPSTRYGYELNFSVSKTGATQAALSYGFSVSSGSITHHRYTVIAGAGATTGAVGFSSIMSGNIANPTTNSAVAAHLNIIGGGSLASASGHNVQIHGVIETGTAGAVAVTPRFAFTQTPTASTILSKSYMKVWPIGPTGSNTTVGTWG